MISRNMCVLVPWTKVPPALEGIDWEENDDEVGARIYFRQPTSSPAVDKRTQHFRDTLKLIFHQKVL